MKQHRTLHLHLPDENATLAFGKRLAHAMDKIAEKTAPASNIIFYLTGELGAGKTTLVRSIFRGLGYEGVIKSPTYTLVESYQLNSINSITKTAETEKTTKASETTEMTGITKIVGDGDGALTIHHFDFYRIQDPKELEFIGLAEYFNNKHTICFIEWPERAAEVLPPPDLILKITILDEGREIEMISESQKGENILEGFL